MKQTKIFDKLKSSKKSEIFLVVGKKGTGKTTFVLNKKTDKKLTVYITDRFLSEMDENDIILHYSKLKEVANFLQNCKIIYDDCRNYIVGNSETYKIVEKILINSRHCENEVYLIYHSINEIPERFFSKCDFILLFKNNSELDNVRFFDLSLRDKIIFANEKLKKSNNIYAYEIIEI